MAYSKKRILTIAGSDSGGGAGIQTDIKTMTVLGGFGMSAITALTAQNTLGVQGVHAVPIDFIRQQLDSVLSDIGADAAKTGMLATSEIVEAVVEGIRRYDVPNLVVDPVMVATSGDPLLADDAVSSLRELLFPLATIITPNLSEAKLLCDFEVDSLDSMKEAAKVIHESGPKFVLVKGGHLGDECTDLFYDGQRFETFSAPRVPTNNTHGTGCTLSAALATFLGQGFSPREAVARAKEFITLAITHSLKIGGGNGPTDPFAHIRKQLGEI